MIKKIVLLFVVLGLVGGGFFYWWQNQADVRELNKTLPEGIRVEKSLFEEEYKVVNHIDGYEFKIPPEWKGVKEVEYVPESEFEYLKREKAEEVKITAIYVEGEGGYAESISIDLYKLKQQPSGLKLWAQNLFQDMGLEGEFTEEDIGGFKTVKTQENIHLGGTHIYFLENNLKIYVFNGWSIEFIEYIIANGKW